MDLFPQNMDEADIDELVSGLAVKSKSRYTLYSRRAMTALVYSSHSARQHA